MKQTMKLLGVLAAFTGLAACTTPHSPNQLAQTTVDYQCGPGGQAPLTVQYTFQGGEALSARVIYQNQVVTLTRATASNADIVGNTFRSDNYTWVTQPFDYDTVGAARGEMLTREIVPPASTVTPNTGVAQPPVSSVTTPVEEVSNIIVRDCVPVMTASST